MNPEILDRLPPNDPDSEKRVLYAMIVDPRRRIDEMADVVSADDFYDPRNSVLFKSLLAMHTEGRKIGADTLVLWLKSANRYRDVGESEWLAEIMFVQHVELSRAVASARAVRDASRRRTMIHTAEELLRSAWDQGLPVEDALERAESALGTIELAAAAEHLVDGPTAATLFLERVEAIDERGEHLGVTTGLWKFDDTFGGLFPGEYCILAADSSAGKTSLGSQIVDWNASKSRLVYVASLEMEAVELTQRLICSISHVNSRLIRTRKLTTDDRARLVDGAQEFSRHAIRIDPRTDLKVSDIRRAARRLLRDGLSMIVVDYIGLVSPEEHNPNREQQVARISRGLKNLAKELRVPVLVLCQLNRTHETSERPQLRHLRESGAIGNDAHMVLFLHKPEGGIVDTEWSKVTGEDGRERNVKTTITREWPAELIVGKNRNGELGTVRLEWIPERTMFECWDRAENMPNYDPSLSTQSREF